MKKILLYLFILLAIAAGIGAWLLFAPATTFEQESKHIYIYKRASAQKEINNELDTQNIIRSKAFFNFVATQTQVWQRVKEGRFQIKKGESIYDIVRMLRNNVQSPVKLVITKLRTNEDLAKKLGQNFLTDSARVFDFLESNDSLAYLNVDTNTVMSMIIPDTYLLKWNTPLKEILNRLQDESKKFWEKNNRLQQAADKGLTPLQVYIIASIVQEETNKNDEKGNIASVYINRLHQGMPLGADPTIKFALKNFGLKRILYNNLKVKSPYNTYLNKGLPPGPICTPSQVTIDAVLNAPKTNFLYFVASSDFNGYHHFSTTYPEHLQYARQYQKALDELNEKKQKTSGL